MYSFPYINHLNDVLPAIKDHPEFLVIDKGDYKVVDYVYTTNDTFPPMPNADDYEYPHDFDKAIRNARILRECRGIIFDRDGKLIARRMHKFFNIDQKEESLVKNIDFSKPHIILEKLDGSQITPFWIDGVCKWGTKKGETEVSAPVQEFVNNHKEYLFFAIWAEMFGITPIFEWCSRKQRIVIDHPDDRLVLLALRYKNSGKYDNYDVMKDYADRHGIDVVRAFNSVTTDLIEFIKLTRELKDMEGYVVRFDTGHMLKVKADWYVAIHQTKDMIASEAKVVTWVINNVLDDVLPLLVMEVDKERVIAYEKAFRKETIVMAHMMMAELLTAKLLYTRKEFALGPANSVDSIKRPIYFKCWDNPKAETIYNAMVHTIERGLHNAKKFAMIKESLFREVKYDY
jgi:RNA ligase